jgi:hypothetical protein
LDKQSGGKKIILKIKLQYLLLLFLVFQSLCAQNSFDNFFKPSDSLVEKRQNTVFISEAIMASGTLIGLNQLWYSDYPRSKFHFINDNSEWLQMDKFGHCYSSYQLGRFGSEMLRWSGTSKKNQLIYGASLGFAFLTTVEVFDGFSAEWGASLGDVAANATGTALYVSQELIWNEQRIIPKFSFHTTQYANYRPDLLGKTTQEQILKDYNGQTYWFSTNLYSFSKKSKIPKWFNVALGYGAEGMIGKNDNKNLLILPTNSINYRKFYLSLDLDLTKINTKSHFLKTVFSVLNSVKIPAPTLEYSSQQGFKFHPLFF